jgi:hypothetical protein
MTTEPHLLFVDCHTVYDTPVGQPVTVTLTTIPSAQDQDQNRGQVITQHSMIA